MSLSTVYAGMDISRDRLDLSVPVGDAYQHRSFNHQPSGHRALIRWLRKWPGIHVICEATGGFERSIMDALHAANIPVSLMNPRKIRDFARAQGRLAKTDRLDAQLLAQYAVAMAPSPTAPRSPTLRQLDTWMDRRRQISGMLQQEKCRLRQASEPEIRNDIRSLIRVLKNRLNKIEQAIEDLQEQDPQLKRAVQRLLQVKGIGLISAMSIIAFMPEIGTLNRRQAAALAGVAPFNCDSGTQRGQRRIWAGRSELRRSLYMVALVASRYNPRFRDFYKRLRENGKNGKVALVAVMRKLIVYINAILKEDQIALT